MTRDNVMMAVVFTFATLSAVCTFVPRPDNRERAAQAGIALAAVTGLSASLALKNPVPAVATLATLSAVYGIYEWAAEPGR